jgi:hypothetical protein
MKNQFAFLEQRKNQDILPVNHTGRNVALQPIVDRAPQPSRFGAIATSHFEQDSSEVRVQPETQIRQPNASYEREADRAAEIVMRMPVPRGMRQVEASPQPQGTLPVLPIMHEVSSSLGQPLDLETRSFMEPYFGHGFSQRGMATAVEAASSAVVLEQHAADHSWTERTILSPRLLSGSMSPTRAQGANRSLVCSPWVQSAIAEDNHGETYEVSSEIASTIQKERRSGKPLEPDVRPELEAASDEDLKDVRIHVNPAADRLNRWFGSAAFTIGNDVFLRESVFHSGTEGGKYILQHEIAHTTRQADSRRMRFWGGGIHKEITRTVAGPLIGNEEMIWKMEAASTKMDYRARRLALAALPFIVPVAALGIIGVGLGVAFGLSPGWWTDWRSSGPSGDTVGVCPLSSRGARAWRGRPIRSGGHLCCQKNQSGASRPTTPGGH